jgi:hypothetical protein
MTRRAGMALGVALLAVGLGLKLQRYLTPPMPLERRGEAAINDLATRQGWHFEGWQRLTSDGSYRAAVFGRAGCPAGLRVVVLAGGAEMSSLAERSLGADTALIAPGERAGGLPLLAVAPRPSEAPWAGGTGACAGPSAQAWRSLSLPPLPPSASARVAAWVWHRL